MQVDSFNLKRCARRIQVQTEYWKEHYRTLVQSPNVGLEFYLHRFRLPRAVLEEPSSQRRNKKSLKIGDSPETRQSGSTVCYGDFGTKWESEERSY